jgi:hypothetical protein
MILEDIQLTGNEHILLPTMPMVRDCKINSQCMGRIKKMRENFEGNEWIEKSTNYAVSQMDNDTKKLIREAGIEIEKAKEVLKEKYPTDYKREFWRVIKKHPFKSLLAWLLK